MKKALLIMTILVMILTVIACSKKEVEPEIVGGWATVEDGTITEELQEIFDKATEGFTGVGYVPVELLETQPVSGTNYKFLCDAITVYPCASTRQAVVTVYVDLEGNASIINIEEVKDEKTSMANPFIDAGTMQEAIDGAGFDAEIPEHDDMMGDVKISYIKDKLIEGVYGEDNGLRIRKGVGNEDISGDYNVYEKEETLEINGRNVTVKGNGDQYNLAVWSEDSYSYSVSSADGMTLTEMTELIGSVK